MNDFNAAPIDWANFLEKFASSRLGLQLQQANSERNFDHAMSLAQGFLDLQLWERPEAGDDGFPVTISFKGLGVVASLYPELREKLSGKVSSTLDELLIPFAGQWMATKFSLLPALDLPEDMKLLAYGALSVALPPKRCEQIAVALQSEWKLELKDVLYGNDHMKTFSSIVKQLSNLILTGAQKEAGVISVYEI